MLVNNTVLTFNKNKPIVLIDGGYYVFYRYFATYRWFAFQKKEFVIETITENEEFVTSFIKHLESDINKICKKWKTDINNIIICSDCQRSQIWRNDIYSEYKGTRNQNVNFNNKIFSIFNDVINKKGIKKINYERLEADDIIYLIQRRIKENIAKSIIIITNDNDYLQLASENINIFNMQFKDITLRGCNNAKSDLYNKAIFGDKSDNIHKIAPFITKEKSLSVSMLEESELIKWLEENNLIDKFKFNMELICFDNIPKKYIDNFYEKYTIEVI